MRRLLTMAGLMVAALGSAQLRVATWNISNYTGGRHGDLTIAMFNSFEGRTFRPDVIVTQEFFSQNAQDSFLAMLNAGPLGPIWQAAPFTNGPDSDHAFFYRTDRVILVGSSIISNGGNAPLPPRDTKRYDVVLLGYSSIAPKLAIYSSHMKAGTASTDRARRLAEAVAIRNDIASLIGFDGVLVGGDLNLYSSTEDAFVKLTGSEADNSGQLFDPIASPGTWDNNSAFRFIHTQDPSGTSGMNSRFDFVLLNAPLRNGVGFDYIGVPTSPYSTTTWNDPLHSYRAWGNDGTSYNTPLTIIGNTMVGPTIAQALVNAATVNGGHLPVFLDLRVPAEIGVSTMNVNFGTVVQSTQASQLLDVFNQGDVFRWGAGVAPLNYEMATSAGFSAPSGWFADLAGGGVNSHAIGMDTSTTGVKSGTVTIATPDDPAHSQVVWLTGQVVPDQLRPSSFSLLTGRVSSGGLAQVLTSDDIRLVLGSDTRTRTAYQIEAEFGFVSPVPTIDTMAVKVESLSLNSLTQQIALFDFLAGSFVTLGSKTLSTFDEIHAVVASQPNRFIQSGTRAMRLRVRYQKPQVSGPAALSSAAIDAIGIELR